MNVKHLYYTNKNTWREESEDEYLEEHLWGTKGKESSTNKVTGKE